MLSQRIKAALIFVPLVLILMYLGGWVFNLFFTIILLAAGYEYAKLFRIKGFKLFLPLILAGILLILIQRWFFTHQYIEYLVSILIFLTVLIALIQYESGDVNAALNFALHLSGIFYIGWIGAFMIVLRAIPDGRGWMLTALPATWLADSGAYFIGRWLGKSKLAPRLSPKKTWAGFIGGVLAGTISGALLILLWRSVDFLPQSTPLWQGAVMGLILAILTPMGDLIISLFKRTAGVKDSSNIIPGHGGILDRIDSWIWAAMIGFYVVTVFR
jgi:phosphatidate cytidylyltransferase